MKLKSRKAIAGIFEHGKHVKVYPIHLAYQIVEEEPRFQIGFSVSKRRFKKAVHRNRIKRLMRESFRLNQGILQNLDANLRVMAIYIGKEEITFSQTQEKFTLALQRLKTETEKST